MENLLPLLGIASLFIILPGLLRLGRLVRGTTLTGAWGWAVFAWGLWEIAWLSRWFPLPVSLQDQIWYAVAILGLCPPIAVLGAKRPGSRVWTAFVVFPLVLVFSWPALADWVHQFPPPRLQLETPVFLGYGLVLVMGFGNYLGTRNSLPALLTGLSLGWLAWQLANPPEPEQSLQPIGPTIALIAAMLIAYVTTSTPPPEPAGWNRVWRDFQNLFGIVWAKRLMERINQTAEKESWPARWEMQGLVWQTDATDEQKENTIDRVDHTLRWLLRRFVDPEWIEERLGPGAGGRKSEVKKFGDNTSAE